MFESMESASFEAAFEPPRLRHQKVRINRPLSRLDFAFEPIDLNPGTTDRQVLVVR